MVPFYYIQQTTCFWLEAIVSSCVRLLLLCSPMIPRRPRISLLSSIFSPTRSIPLRLHSSSSSSSFSTSPSPDRLSLRDWLSPNEVITIIQRITDPPSVLEFLHRWSNRKDYKPNEAIYILIVSKLAEGRLFDAIDNLMLRIKAQKNCRLSDAFFFHVIKIYGNVAGRISKAIETLFDMPNYNCWPSVKTFNYVLNLLVSAKLFDVVHEVYMGAPKLGIEIDACCLNILVKGLCESGNVDAALKVLDEFPQQRCRPNVRTFSTLIHGLCENGELERAAQLFSKMENEGVCPDTITFNILISGLRKHKRIEEAIELLERMKLKGCYPNAGTYQEVLYGLLDTSKFVEARDCMRRMILDGMDPSFVSYKKLISGLCKKNLTEDVDWVLRQMVMQGFAPKMGMWKLILRCMLSGNEDYIGITGKAFEDILLLTMEDGVMQ
ncbi:pentatricopeptide repeat-containing protein At3g14580, mitochondrial [Momordica charantia]|uniref:Pentatricopeptide repeat-containing protein At3g14580, mitochondrial n=1 Tax=Momordica charantia TaxID=3673 RepID=A0A6J1BWL8_MOMCH|nr:pentatricopeptide repeat-containing protein At3g14580, mitochondrial [Momordica charantia]